MAQSMGVEWEGGKPNNNTLAVESKEGLKNDQIKELDSIVVQDNEIKDKQQIPTYQTYSMKQNKE